MISVGWLDATQEGKVMRQFFRAGSQYQAKLKKNPRSARRGKILAKERPELKQGVLVENTITGSQGYIRKVGSKGTYAMVEISFTKRSLSTFGGRRFVRFWRASNIRVSTRRIEIGSDVLTV